MDSIVDETMMRLDKIPVTGDRNQLQVDRLACIGFAGSIKPDAGWDELVLGPQRTGSHM